jgi:Rieske 2Fe-2S family protein
MTIQTPISAEDRFASIRQPLDQARHLPGSIYVTDEYWGREKSQIFTREWLMVCREEQVARPGDYVALRIMGESVLVVRTRDGSIKALANVCRHRGVEVARGAGHTPMFVCPYHAWTYDLDGKLKSAPFMGAGRNAPENCNLLNYHVANWRGNIFVNLSGEPRDFDEFIAPFERDFGFLGFEKTKLARIVEFDMRCNWKLSLENLIDIYHVGTVHAKTFGSRYKDKDNFKFNLLPDGSTSLFYEAAPLTADGKSLVGKMPWLADRPDTFACVGLLWPNLRLSARSDYLRVWNIWPIEPGRTIMRLFMLFPEQALEQPDFPPKLDSYAEFMKVAIEEDREMIESLQLGVASLSFDPGPLANLEVGIHHFLNHYSAQVGPQG